MQVCPSRIPLCSSSQQNYSALLSLSPCPRFWCDPHRLGWALRPITALKLPWTTLKATFKLAKSPPSVLAFPGFQQQWPLADPTSLWELCTRSLLDIEQAGFCLLYYTFWAFFGPPSLESPGVKSWCTGSIFLGGNAHGKAVTFVPQPETPSLC